ncbi:GtrA family protein [Xanthomonas sacchari]|uniref:GtrA family protein n=1 Tax=Xanthomonas sacchari TaxID=56458 RepID=UPI002253A776|nr:GtrA family protein [Xanthomonas sacchari]
MMFAFTRQAIRYGLVGVLNTLVCLLVMYALTYCGGVGAYAANACGYVVGFMASFFFNKIWTFGSRSPFGKSFPRYLLCAGIAYGMNIGMVYVGLQFYGAGPYWIQVAGAIVYTVVLFVLSRTFVFSDKSTLTDDGASAISAISDADLRFANTAAGERASGKRHLLVAYYPPQRGTGGGLRLLDLYSLLSRSFPEVTFDLLTCRHEGEDSVPELAQLFEKIHWVNADDFNVRGLAACGLWRERYDIVDLQFLQSGELVRAFRASGTPLIVVSPMESLARSAWLGLRSGRVPLSSWLRQDLRWAIRELLTVWRADKVMCVSENDAKFLRPFRFWGGVHAVETGVSDAEFPNSLGAEVLHRRLEAGRCVTFLAYFGSQTNRDALAWFLAEVHPVLLKAFADYRFRVVGRALDASLQRTHERVEWVGEVDSLEDELRRAWVGIAPALGGAGLRGKINQYAAVGVPCVASSIAGGGLAYEDGVSIRLAADAGTFARACIELMNSKEANIEAGLAARSVCIRHYSWNSRVGELQKIFGF